MALNDVPKPSPTGKVPAKRQTKRSTAAQKSRLDKKAEQLAKEQRQLAIQIKAVDRVSQALDGKARVIQSDDLDMVTPTVRKRVEDQNIIFKPNEGPQTEFLATTVRECLYGGAAGGGKSYAMLADPLRYVHIGDFRGVLFRRTNDELRELISKSKELYTQAFPTAKFQEQKSTWVFPSGATLWMTYLEADDDVQRMVGQAFNWIGWDELTHWPNPYPFLFLRSRLRTTNPQLPLCVRATTNPGGPGAHWVRKLFVDAAPWGTIFPAVDIETGQPLVYPKGHAKEGQPLFYAQFIPAKLSDNPTLFADGQYEANLLSMPEAQRRRLLEGDWDVSENCAFPEFRRATHVVKHFDIPPEWPRFRAADWGYSSPFCVLWFAVDPDNNLYVYREFYDKKHTADIFARKVREMEKGDRIRYGILDGSAWSRRGELGPSPAETMIMNGCRWRAADRSPGSRKHGKLEIHKRLSLTEDYNGNMRPSLFIFEGCVNLIREISTIPLDKNDQEDTDTKASDHAYDALRYGVMSRMKSFNPDDNFASGGFVASDDTFGY